jgi:NADPH-dependent 2,4-dienoyl-CoA reductase/sulfur reductase-like enzyme/rhodanese-related sulfurtransferase
VVIGGVAGGASAAARLRRLDEQAEIVVIERSGNVSFANCGLPYHLSGAIAERRSLLLQTPESLRANFDLDVRVLHEVTAIDPAARVVSGTDLRTGGTFSLQYDALVLSPGASPIRPPIPGSERGLTLRDVEDLDRIGAAVTGARSAVIVGGGFVGLEMAENLRERGLDVTIVELAPQVLAPVDAEMVAYVHDELLAHDVALRLGHSVVELTASEAVLDDGERLPADLVIFAIGVRPETTLARAAGLSIGERGGIVVDEHLRTSDPHVWAVGDATEKSDSVLGGGALVPLANLANRQGRRAADSIVGTSQPFTASHSSAVVRVFGLTVAVTGANERRLRAAGHEVLALHTHPGSHAGYFPGAETMHLKLLVDPADGRILGAQGVGRDGIDKRIDVISTAMSGGITAPGLADLELAYAPMYGSAKDPVNLLGYLAENVLLDGEPVVAWHELAQRQADGWLVVDVRQPAEVAAEPIDGAVNIPLDQLRDRLGELAGRQVVCACAVGQRGHAATRLLRQHGIDAANLIGGYRTLGAAIRTAVGTVAPAR